MKKTLKAFLAIALSLVVLFSFTACSIEDVLSEIFPDMFPKEDDVTPGVQVKTDELSIHFLTLGNKYTGDAIYIKINDVDILIDAGSRNSSEPTITNYIKQYCTDGKLEYVIATHAHQDHIAAFGYTSKINSVFDEFECETIIDFPKTNATSSVYDKYLEKLNAEVKNGAKHYTALECWNNQNGAQREYTLADNVTMKILYNYYYENETTNENNYSVCVLISQGDKHYLFTGDLEDKGEEYLVQYNKLPECVLFKAAHHGSYTGTNDVLLDVIKPQNIVVTAVAGSDEYTSTDANMFPSQAFIDRAEKYTDNIYCTSIVSDNANGYEDLNGNIVVKSDGEKVSFEFSASDTLLKDTDWYKAHRAN